MVSHRRSASVALFRLVDDMMRDLSVRKRFNLDPNDVIREYGLSVRERRLLLTMDPAVISANVPPQMQQEVNGYQLPVGDFPPESEDFFAEDGGLDPQYPSPAPGIFRYRTNPLAISAAAINAKASVSFEVAVFGQSLLECELKLVRVADGREATITHFFRIGTFRCSILRAVFSPPAPDASWTAGHQYKVTVVNLPAAAAALKKTFEAKPILVVNP
jgi:hypothetical protein